MEICELCHAVFKTVDELITHTTKHFEEASGEGMGAKKE